MSVEMFKEKDVLGVVAVCIIAIVIVWFTPMLESYRIYILGLIVVLSGYFCYLFGTDIDDDDTEPVPSATPEPVPDLTPKEAAHVEEHVPAVVDPSAFLSELPIETIEGIGKVYGDELRSAGVVTVQDLLSSDAAKVAEICDVPEEQASRWIAMGRFAWIDGISEEDAEAIVFATGITTLEELANANADDVLAVIQKALKDGTVRVPSGYKFTIEMVRRWIEEVKGVLV